ncbi:MAG: MogA/MoaB family molybdenum cofactor biosynthesis protein [Bryobacterales bacterium]|nr:MogA/MoaB family molybdenum cofactor biosynthesis protein [Bryobacterales bacterium]
MASESNVLHRRLAAREGPVTLAVVTVSDSRTPKTDANAAFLTEAVEESGNLLHSIRIVPDEPDQVAEALDELAAEELVQVVLFNGGTGVSRRDRTYDVLSRAMDKELTGFGELFRMLSYDQVGAAAMLSRATAGVYRDTVVISVPGSPAAVRLAWEKLIQPELAHLAWEIAR